MITENLSEVFNFFLIIIYMKNKNTLKLKKSSRFCLILFIISAFLLTNFPSGFYPAKKARAATDATIYFDHNSINEAVGEDFNLVAMVDPGTNEVGAVDLYLSFDPDVLQLTSITRSSAFNTTLQSTFDNNAGTAVFSAGLLTTPSSYITTTSEIATFLFHAEGAGSTNVEFTTGTQAASHGEDVTLSATGAEVTITGEATTYTIGGSISGLDGTVVLQNNGTDDLSKSADGSFTFSDGLTNGSSYAVTVATQPDNQTCTVTNGSGTVSSANVTNVSVSCVTGADETAPVRSGGSPSGELDDDTSSVTLSITTGENATCKFSTTARTPYSSMTNTFSGASGTSHTYRLTGLDDGETYGYFVRCQDSSLNVNTDDYVISFYIEGKSDSDSDSKKETEKKKKRKLYINPRKVYNGQVLHESGRRFSKNSSVALYFSKPDGSFYPPKIVKTDSSGKFAITYLVKNKPAGKYKWYAVDLKTGKRSKNSVYRIK
jgi:hypothetical protein